MKPLPFHESIIICMKNLQSYKSHYLEESTQKGRAALESLGNLIINTVIPQNHLKIEESYLKQAENFGMLDSNITRVVLKYLSDQENEAKVKEEEKNARIKMSKAEFHHIMQRPVDDPVLLAFMEQKGIKFDSGVINIDVADESEKFSINTSKKNFAKKMKV